MHDTPPPVLMRWLSAPARIAMMFAAMFFVTGVATPFLPVWLRDHGLTVGEIGLLSIIPQLVRSVVAPLVGFAADRHLAHRELAIFLTAIGAAAFVVLSHTAGFTWALLAMIVVALSNTAAPLVETIAMSSVRLHGHDYGRMRLWGSAAFVAANLAAGWAASRFGTSALIALMTVGAATSCAVSCLLPRTAAPGNPGIGKPLTFADARLLLHIPQLGLVLVSAGAVQGAHGMFYAYGTLHWQTLGLQPSWFGALWAIGLITEIALFFWSKDAVRAFGAVRLMIGGAALSVLRWLLMACDPPLAVLVPLQILHGLTFGASHLGAMHVLAKLTPIDRAATAQALYALVATLGIVMATAISARVYPLAGGLTYLAMALMATVSLAAALVVHQRQTAAEMA